LSPASEIAKTEARIRKLDRELIMYTQQCDDKKWDATLDKYPAIKAAEYRFV
jgi:hypothetical protein